jgi:catechol 2,3-dioxygenase-like lactoylglutathione lyase family enzyme
MHIVDDFDSTAELYDRLFAPDVYAPKHWSDFDKRWALLGVVGPDFVLEIMEASRDPADAGSPLPRFYNRHGNHLHSFAWLVDAADHRQLAERMGKAGIRVLTPYGSLEPQNGAPGASTFFTHPKDTFGQLEFQAWSADTPSPPHTRSDWDAAPWREHPIGLVGMSHLTTVVADLERAKSFYENLLDAPTFFEETTGDRRSAFALVGEDTVVEIAQPLGDDSPLAVDLATHGELPHAMTFKVLDVDAAARHVQSLGIGIARDETTVRLDPSDMHDAVVAFTTRRLPGDPRG